MKSISSYQIDTQALKQTIQQAQLSALIETQHNRLYQFILRKIRNVDDAADLTQQTFVEAYGALANFQGNSELSSWLYGIALKIIQNYLSRSPNRVYQFEGEETLAYLSSNTVTPEKQVSAEEDLTILQNHFDALSDDRRAVLEMVVIDDMSYEEVADALQIPIGTVRSRVSRARKQLETSLESAGINIHFFKNQYISNY